MKRNLIYSILILILALASCKSKEKEKKIEEIPPYLPQLINWGAMNERGWENMNFPIWFSADQIDSLGIEKIGLEFTNYSFTDTILQITDTLPYQLIDVDFKEDGDVGKAIIKEFSSGIEIAKNSFNYKTPIDNYRYSSPNISSEIKYGRGTILSFVNTLQELQQYRRLVLEEKNDSILKFLDKSSNEETHHYFILDSLNWNVSYIDQHFKSLGNDIFYFGSPEHFIASFSLRNLVEKTKKEERSYYPTGTLRNQYFYNEGFITKRYYKYDSLGFCIGFSDSLVTDSDEFLHVEKGVVKYSNKVPKSVYYYNEEDSLMVDPIRMIQFSYTYGK